MTIQEKLNKLFNTTTVQIAPKHIYKDPRHVVTFNIQTTNLRECTPVLQCIFIGHSKNYLLFRATEDDINQAFMADQISDRKF